MGNALCTVKIDGSHDLESGSSYVVASSSMPLRACMRALIAEWEGMLGMPDADLNSLFVHRFLWTKWFGIGW